MTRERVEGGIEIVAAVVSAFLIRELLYRVFEGSHWWTPFGLLPTVAGCVGGLVVLAKLESWSKRRLGVGELDVWADFDADVVRGWVNAVLGVRGWLAMIERVDQSDGTVELRVLPGPGAGDCLSVRVTVDEQAPQSVTVATLDGERALLYESASSRERGKRAAWPEGNVRDALAAIFDGRAVERRWGSARRTGGTRLSVELRGSDRDLECTEGWCAWPYDVVAERRYAAYPTAPRQRPGRGDAARPSPGGHAERLRAAARSAPDA